MYALNAPIKSKRLSQQWQDNNVGKQSPDTIIIDPRHTRTSQFARAHRTSWVDVLIQFY